MVAVNGGRDRDFLLAGLHELQQRHLRGRVLHRDTIGRELDVALPALELGGGGIVEVAVDDLLGERERTAEPGADRGETATHLVVRRFDELRRALDRWHGASFLLRGASRRVAYSTNDSECQGAAASADAASAG